MTKHPKQKAIPAPQKTPREEKAHFVERIIREDSSTVLRKEAVALPIRSRMQMKMMWSSERKDIVGRWSWGQFRNWGKPFWRKTLLPFLKSYEKKSWAEIEKETAGADRRFKSYDVFCICQEAQRRLQCIDLDDMEVISRFRLGNMERLYGFICQHVFFVLWWDPDHRIYPSDIQRRGKRRR